MGEQKNLFACWTHKSVKCTRSCALLAPPDQEREERCDGVKVLKKTDYTCASFFTESHGQHLKKIAESKGARASLVSLNVADIYEDQEYAPDCKGCKETLKARKAYCVDDCESILKVWKPVSWYSKSSNYKALTDTTKATAEFRAQMMTMAQGATF